MMNEGMSPADMAAVMGNNNGGMFGDNNGAWWIIILFLFAFMGGWGNMGAGGQGAAQNYVLASDFATLQRQMSDGFSSTERRTDAIINGICDSSYTNAQLINGVQMGQATQGYETRNAITQAQIAQMQSANALQGQLSSCCCDMQRQVERGFCDTNYNLATNTTNIVQNAHADTDRVLAKLNEMEATRQQERIAALQSENQGLKFMASQQAQNSYLVNQLRPAPVPAFSVPNPYAYNGCGNGCGC